MSELNTNSEEHFRMFAELGSHARRGLSDRIPVFSEAALQLRPAPAGKGDVAISCGILAKETGVSVADVADHLVAVMRSHTQVRDARVVGPFVNFSLTRNALYEGAVRTAHDAHSLVRTATAERITLEFLSPNTNKPLHLGHVRNGVLGMATANLLSELGHTVTRINLSNDRGAAICQSMLGYQLFGEDATPQSSGVKSDHFVGNWYVKLAQARREEPERFDQLVRDMLERWEAGDSETLELWSVMNGWFRSGYEQTMHRYGFRHDMEYRESDLYRLGRDIVQAGVERGVFQALPDGAVVYPLDTAKFGMDADGQQRKVTVLRSNGTTLYVTQDLGTAVRRAEEHRLDRSIYVVASEQRGHFRELFDMLGALGYSWVSKCHHLSYGMVELPEGRMKSREGTVVDADDLLDEVTALVSEYMRAKQSTLPVHQLEYRAGRIALAAIKFFLLLPSPDSTIRFNPKQSLSFEGDTGPYCLYAYARVKNLLRRANMSGFEASNNLPFISLGTEEERILALAIAEFPNVVARAAESYNPSMLAQKVLALAKLFNRFYASCNIQADDYGLKEERLELCSAVGKMLRWGLNLLGIEVLEQM